MRGDVEPQTVVCGHDKSGVEKALLDDLIRARQHAGWHSDPKRFSSLEIEDQLKLRGRLDCHLSGILTF